jgi:hypothetical protein
VAPTGGGAVKQNTVFAQSFTFTPFVYNPLKSTMGKNAKYFAYTELIPGPPPLSFGSFEDDHTPTDEEKMVLKETLSIFMQIIKRVKQK